MIRVGLCNSSSDWDRYVADSPEASNYHRWVWGQVVQETYGHTPYYLGASEGGVLRGILPLVSIRSWLTGNSLVSVPFFSYGGVLADNEEAANALIEKATSLAGELRARHIELRQGMPSASGWQSTSAKVIMEIDLPPTEEELWKRLSSRLRNKIRNAEKHGFRVQWGGIEEVGNFYPVFAANMRNLGTPVYPRSWFQNLCRRAPDGIRIVTLWEGEKPVAGAFLSSFRETMEAPWIASLPEARKKYSSVLLYWTFLKWAIGQGSRKFDLGRCTPGGGTWEFKRLWGCNERPVHFYHWVPPGAAVPELRPGDVKYRWAVRIWKHLPLPVTNALGPRLVRVLP